VDRVGYRTCGLQLDGNDSNRLVAHDKRWQRLGHR
jgi:hypothetical protein